MWTIVAIAYTFSTSVSFEEELNTSANMDVGIVILSYLAMFFYISLTLGNGAAAREDDGFFTALKRSWVPTYIRKNYCYLVLPFFQRQLREP